MLLLVFLAAGCQSTERLKYDVDRVPRVAIAYEGIVWRNAADDSDLYRVPTPPANLTSRDAEDFLLGHRIGWENKVKWAAVGVLPGAPQLFFSHYFGFINVTNQSEAFKQGQRAGAAQARIDFNTFCLKLEKQLKK